MNSRPGVKVASRTLRSRKGSAPVSPAAKEAGQCGAVALRRPEHGRIQIDSDHLPSALGQVQRIVPGAARQIEPDADGSGKSVATASCSSRSGRCPTGVWNQASYVTGSKGVRAVTAWRLASRSATALSRRPPGPRPG